MDTTPVTLTDTIAFDSKIDSLFAQQKITLKDIETFNKTERQQLSQAAIQLLAELNGTERDEFLNKLDAIIPTDTKYSLWEYNHAIKLWISICKIVRSADEIGYNKKLCTSQKWPILIRLANVESNYNDANQYPSAFLLILKG